MYNSQIFIPPAFKKLSTPLTRGPHAHIYLNYMIIIDHHVPCIYHEDARRPQIYIAGRRCGSLTPTLQLKKVYLPTYQ